MTSSRGTDGGEIEIPRPSRKRCWVMASPNLAGATRTGKKKTASNEAALGIDHGRELLDLKRLFLFFRDLEFELLVAEENSGLFVFIRLLNLGLV